MRTFIAIEISQDIKTALAQAIAHLKYAGADVKWVRPEAAHLTLKFLGEIDEARSRDVAAALDSIAASTARFELRAAAIGAFPGIDRPRVVWIGLDNGADESRRLADSVDDEMSRLGFEKESRQFSPHLTIGRVRSSKNREWLKEKILSYDSQSKACSCEVSSIILFKSTLTPQGSIYIKLHEAQFRA
jgi:2'-5' RNA ligase